LAHRAFDAGNYSHAAPDGYTLLLLGATHAINAGFYGRLAVNLNRDIVPVAALSNAPMVMVVHPLVPAKTVAEFRLIQSPVASLANKARIPILG
jgi:tripartite-type tricarboxylate transporter receptor subunit TctC